jgi:site-specific recombinase XerD
MSERFIEFFTANIRNRNTRMAYALAVRQFFDWCEQRASGLEAIRPRIVAAYIEPLGAEMAKPSVKEDLAAIRQLFDYLAPHMQNGGTLEHAQQIAAHESPRTTKLYDRRDDQISLDEVERIRI